MAKNLVMGNQRSGENPFLLSLGITWFRHHNWIARELRSQHKDWDDYTVFQEARTRNIAVFQKITMYEWIPLLLGNCTDSSDEYCEPIPPYKAYNPVEPVSISNVFQAAAMRYLYTLYPPGVFIRSQYNQTEGTCEFYKMNNATAGPDPALQEKHVGKPALRLCNSYWNSNEAVEEYGIDKILMGMASQVAEKEDHIFTPDLLNYYYGPRHFSRRDEMALSIQLGRDHGLKDYDRARFEFGFPTLNSFEDINPELFASEGGEKLLEDLKMLHNDSFDDMDIFTGGVLETKGDGYPGPLFRKICLNQFLRMRDGDRFWFENSENGLFTEEERESIRQTTIRDVILRTNPHLNEDLDIQENPFVWNSNEQELKNRIKKKWDEISVAEIRKSISHWKKRLRLVDSEDGGHIDHLDSSRNPKARCPQPFQIKADDLEDCVPLHTFDYFEGSDVPFLALYCSLTALVMTVVGSMYGVGYMHQEKRKRQEELETSKLPLFDSLTTSAVESLGKRNRQKVKVKLGPGYFISIISRERERKMEMEGETTVLLNCDKKQNYLVIQNDVSTYDLILSFYKPGHRQIFLERLKGFLVGPLRNWTVHELKKSEMFRRSHTKEQRDKALTKFFQNALAHSMNLRQEENELPDGSKMRKLINIKISKYEFAQFLKMKEDSLFVTHLFNTADKNNDGFISYKEFRNIIVLFTQDTNPDEKLRLMFDMYDLDRSGWLRRDEFELMVRSMVESFSSILDVEYLDKSITSMISMAGGDVKEGLNFEDFKNLMLGLERHSNQPRGRHGRRLSEAVIGTDINRIQKPPPPKNYRRRLSSAVIETIDLTKASREALRKRRVSESNLYVTMSGMMKRKFSSTALDRYQESMRRLEKQHASIGDVTEDEILDATLPKVYKHNSVQKLAVAFEKYIQYHTLEIFWFCLYGGATLGVFLYYFYKALYNHGAGWLGVSEYAIPVALGSAGALMFNLSTLLLTMCRNSITGLRDTWIARYVPFDNALTGHKMVSWMALGFITSHVVAQGVNYYAIATQYSDDLLCLFPDYWYPSTFYPTFTFWSMRTVTGVTGIILIVIVVIVYVYSCEYARRKIYAWFNWTHTVGVFLLYLFIALHGNGLMLETPTFFFYYFGPLKIYVLDKLYTLSRKKTEIPVVNAELLPSNVTNLKFKRPTDFDYKAGQWVKLACPALSPEEFHPFTLTSAPHEELLSVHIRAVGPWTKSIRKVYNKDNLGESPYPKLYVDGPFGEGHQDWYKYEISVLIGGGIGVTPFASILKDWINSEYKVGLTCKRIYFLWITRDQKQYEWLTDIIQDVEKRDRAGMFRAHIFITQFPEKFDLRTTMLYICEKNFHKVAGKSMFTGLKSETHFGRPNFKQFFEYLASRHYDVEKLGIFSRGPRPMTRDVDRTCSQMNQFEGPIFSHHYEN